MHLSEFRILDITDSLWLLLISLLILGIILLRTFKAKNIVYIALALSLYGCAFCWFITLNEHFKYKIYHKNEMTGTLCHL